MRKTGTTAYAAMIDGLQVGKRLPTDVYVHRSAMHMLPTALAAIVDNAEALAVEAYPDFDGRWDVMKIGRKRPTVSLLVSPRFLVDGFPAVHAAYTVDPERKPKVKRTVFGENKPIYHRKEQFLDPRHPDVPTFAALTAAAEREGLFADTKKIGYQKFWGELLDRKGLTVVGQKIVRRRGRAGGVAQEHSSAGTSRPIVPSLFSEIDRRFGWAPGSTNFDLGGGKYDLTTEYLRERGVQNLVFDPYNRSEAHNKRVLDYARKHGVDRVTCANVLNVIKEPAARAQVIEFARSVAGDYTPVFFAVYYASGRKAGMTRDGWQEQRTLRTYLPEVQAHFPHVALVGGMIVASVSRQALADLELFNGRKKR